jgi:ABC-2 type transport system ATP-binding protein
MVCGMTTAALRTVGLTKRYGERAAVDHLDLDVPAGVVAGFVGPNGAGKTTTMAMLLGLVRPSAGEGFVLGHSIARPATYLRRVGALIESPAFYPGLTGIDNLRLFATVAGHKTDPIGELLTLVGLESRGADRVRSYSLGMKQRLGIAAALLGDPEVLILDEPSNGLDPQGVREMRTLLATLAASGRTLLVSSHDLSELQQVCDWMVLIDNGAVRYQGPTDELLSDASASLVVAPGKPAQLRKLERLLGDLGHTARMEHDRLIVDVRRGGDVAEVAAAINQAAFDNGVVLAQLHPQLTSLEDRYLSLVEGSTR